MRIKILPASVANVIAAGEVVERPSSVVKELMENAVDAGADNVRVIVSDAGRTLINVIDNGCGMSPEEAVMCFERHATSKIATAEDLADIRTFGFRGEALASIAAVAEVTLKTRRSEDEVGFEVSVADSKLVSSAETACPVGSNFAVRNLFYNVPGRRKFLKSDNVELKHIIAEFSHVAMTRPDVAFSLIHNGKEIFILKKAMSLKFRISDLAGAGAASELVDMDAETSVASISGFIGRPDMARKNQGNQFFFVNGRYFRSPYLHKAVMKAYDQVVAPGFTPSYFIYIETDPDKVDVNVSPRKTEVKFEDDSVMFQVLCACVREHLARNSFSSGIDFDVEGAPEIPVVGKHFEEFRQVGEPGMSVDPAYNPFENDGFPSEALPGSGAEKYPSVFPSGLVGGSNPEGLRNGAGLAGFGRGVLREERQDYGKLFEDRVLPSSAAVVLHNRFIVTAVRSGLLVVNIRRARERIMYERFLKMISANGHGSQTVLFPVEVEVGAENVPLFEEYSGMLTAAGFDIRTFGRDRVAVNGVPEGFCVREEKVREMVGDLVTALSDGNAAVPETLSAIMAERFAKIGAAGDEPVSSTVEARRLIDLLFACNNSDYTNSGRRTMIIIPLEDIERKF